MEPGTTRAHVLFGRVWDWIVGPHDHRSPPQREPSGWHAVAEPSIALPVVLGSPEVPADASSDARYSAAEGPEGTGVAPVAPRAPSLREAIRWTVLYGSIFDYPLTREEVYRFLMAPGGSREEVEIAIDDALGGGDGLATNGLFLYPQGRSDTVRTRLRRRENARRVWRRARVYARLMWTLPYVRMVAVTGALAMDNVEKGDDIDFMVVTEPGRLWVTRGMILILVRLARAWGDTLCPNYIISSRALRLEQQDPYTAHELAQMTPIHGRQVAERLWAENAWCREFLPNARSRGDEGTDDSLPGILMALKALGQAVLDQPLGSRIERWEQRRKIAKLSRDVPLHRSETHYTADVCKGHADGHGSRVLQLWAMQIEQHRGGYDVFRPDLNGVPLDPHADLR